MVERSGGATAGAAQVSCAAGGGVGGWPGVIISLSGDVAPRIATRFRCYGRGRRAIGKTHASTAPSSLVSPSNTCDGTYG
jgi:hypothetical protein